MDREHKKIITSACLAHKAGMRLATALPSWASELSMEIDTNLTEIVEPLKRAYMDAKALLIAATTITPPSPWRHLLDQLTPIVTQIAQEVTQPWTEVEKVDATSPAAVALREKWRANNPLQAAQAEVLKWQKQHLQTWLQSTSQTTTFSSLPPPFPQEDIKYFLACSTEARPLAEALITAIQQEKSTWRHSLHTDTLTHHGDNSQDTDNNGTHPRKPTLAALEKAIKDCHFGIYLLTAADEQHPQPLTTIHGSLMLKYGIGVGSRSKDHALIVHDSAHIHADHDDIASIPYRSQPQAGITQPNTPDHTEITRIAREIIQRITQLTSTIENQWRTHWENN